MTVAFDRVLLIALALLGWHGLSVVTPGEALPGPVETLRHLAGMLATRELWAEARETAKAVGLAMLVATSLGLGFGLWFAMRRFAGQVAEPLLIAAYALPKVALYPLILLVFGISLEAKVAFGALHGIVPIALFTIAGIKSIAPVYMASARVMGLTGGQRLRHVLLPAALPEVLAGLRIGLSLTLLGTLVGEMFAARSGLGYLLVKAIPRIDNATIMALTVFLLTVAIALNSALTLLEGRARRGRA